MARRAAVLRFLVPLVLLAGVTAVPAQVQAAKPKCAGEIVTINANKLPPGSTVNGTAGDDVIQGTDEDDTIKGAAGRDIICGGGGDDKIDGGPDHDKLLGETGNDRFVGNDVASDAVIGGSDKDVVGYQKVSAAVEVDVPTGTVRLGGFDSGGSVKEIEQVVGSQFGDTLQGGSGRENLNGWKGNDVISGGRGDDLLEGGDGLDEVSYADAPSPGIVMSTCCSSVAVGSFEEDDLYDHFEIVTGSGFDDKLYGTGEADALNGGDGYDVLKGFGGDDTLDGGPGNDTFYPGPGDDIVVGGPNDPVVDAKHPGDSVSYRDAVVKDGTTKFDDYSVSLIPDPPFEDTPYANVEGHDTLSEIESARGPMDTGDAYNFIDGDDGPNILIGGNSHDFLAGYGGNDWLYGKGDNDNLNGGEGDDFLDSGASDSSEKSELLFGDYGTDTCTGGDNTLWSSCEIEQ